jgi:LCP family protein required for cell wall assembly
VEGLSSPESENVAASIAHRTRRIAVRAVSILLVLMVATGAAYLAFLNHTVTSNIKHEALLPTSSSSDPAIVKDPVAKDAQNILLVGLDTHGNVTYGRSDAIILMHISSDRKKVYLVHFPRDMYVNIPGHGKDKINVAFAHGGSQLLVHTLRNLVDVSIDHMAVIGFDGFEAMTDAVGGVDVYAEEASSDYYGTIKVGMNHLDGKTALGFVQERYQLSRGDISRGRRQQAFIKALILKVLSKETITNPVRIASFIDAATRYLTVDNALSLAELRSQVLAMRDLRGEDIVFITAPITGFGTSPLGASIDIVDDIQMAQLSVALSNDDMSNFLLNQQNP